MAITYDLNIFSLKRKLSVDDLENVIIEVSIGVSAQSQEYPQLSYNCSGNISFDISQIDSDSFVPFEEVTKETVLDWILAKEGIETLDEFSYVKASIKNIQARIDELQVEDVVNVGWSVTNVSEPEVVEEEQPQEEILEA
jgi:hypothetical protein